jgi:hypothetical protein
MCFMGRGGSFSEGQSQRPEGFTFSQARRCDPSKPWAEAIEPAMDADGCDRKIADRRIVNTFDASSPRSDASCHKRPFVMLIDKSIGLKEVAYGSCLYHRLR